MARDRLIIDRQGTVRQFGRAVAERAAAEEAEAGGQGKQDHYEPAGLFGAVPMQFERLVESDLKLVVVGFSTAHALPLTCAARQRGTAMRVPLTRDNVVGSTILF